MARLRSEDALTELISAKFDELKNDFIASVKQSLVEDIKNQVKNAVDTLIKEHKEEVEKLDSKVSMLQEHVNEFR